MTLKLPSQKIKKLHGQIMESNPTIRLIKKNKMKDSKIQIAYSHELQRTIVRLTLTRSRIAGLLFLPHKFLINKHPYAINS